MIQKIVLCFFVLLGLFVTPIKIRAFESGKAPINGTFLMSDFSYNSVEEWAQYFADLKELGMNLIIPTGLGSVDRSDSCRGPYTYSTLLDKTYNFPEGVMVMILKAAHKANFQVYLGLASNGGCVKPESSADSQELISYSKKLIDRIKTLYEEQGWDWQNGIIKGFYIPQELDVRTFSVWRPYFDHYINTAREIKLSYPGKKIMISPYLFEEDNYQTIYNNIKFALENSAIDIYAPQDSVGTRKTTSYNSSRTHFQAMNQAIRDHNRASGKNVELWANVESFTCPTGKCGNLIELPAEYPTLAWQIRAVEDLVTNKITWIHQWSLAQVKILDNYSYYTADFAIKRKKLREKYLNIPLTTAAFKWNDSFVLKGYNYGQPGDPINIYLHYQDTQGQAHQVNKSVVVKSTSDPGFNYSEVWVPIQSFADIDINKPFEVAVQNHQDKIGYHRSHNIESNSDPSFPEIKTFTTPASKTVMSNGDFNQDGKIDLLDFMVWKKEYVTKLTKVSDANNDGRVDFLDFGIWKKAFLSKTGIPL